MVSNQPQKLFGGRGGSGQTGDARVDLLLGFSNGIGPLPFHLEDVHQTRPL